MIILRLSEWLVLSDAVYEVEVVQTRVILLYYCSLEYSKLFYGAYVLPIERFFQSFAVVAQHNYD